MFDWNNLFDDFTLAVWWLGGATFWGVTAIRLSVATRCESFKKY